MSNNNNNNNNNNGAAIGISTVDVLQIVFIVLKLCKVITWSWWWVLAPTWIGILLAIIVILSIIIWIK